MRLLNSIGLMMLIVPTAWALTSTGEWTALTSKARPACDDETACRVMENGHAFEIKLDVEIKQSQKMITKVEIRNLKTGLVQSFPMTGVNKIGQDEIFNLYQVHLRPTGDTDLALHAYNSAHEGPSYYYFIYDRAHQNFVFSGDVFPKLIFDGKTKRYFSDLQHSEYGIGKNLKPAPTSKKL